MKLAPIIPPPGTPDEIMWLIDALNRNFQDLEQLTRRGLRAPLGKPGLPSIGFQNPGFDGIGASAMQDLVTGAVQGILWEADVIRHRAASPATGAAAEVIPNSVPDAGGVPARISALETDVTADPENFSRVDMQAGTDMKIESYKRGAATLRDLTLGVDDGSFTEAIRISKTEVAVNNPGIGTMDFRVEGDTESNLIFADASTDRVGIGEGTPTSTLDVDGSMALPTSAISTTITADGTQHTLLVDATGAARIINLPAAATVPGRIYIVKKIDASVNTVTIDPSGAELIDGAATKVLTAQWDSIKFQSDGAAWFIVADKLAGGGGGSPHPLLDGVENNDTTAAAPIKGAIIVGNDVLGTVTWTEHGPTTNGFVLTVDSTKSNGVDWKAPASGSAGVTQVEVDLGSRAGRSGSFTITDGALAALENIVVLQAAGPYTGKGTREDEAEMDQVTAAGFVAAGGGSATVYWNSPLFVKGNFKFNYMHGS